MTLFEKLFILIGSLWIVVLLFIAYTWIIQRQQQGILRYIALRLMAIEKEINHKKNSKIRPTEKGTIEQECVSEAKSEIPVEAKITINKNEPIAKYETVSLPDEIDINFVDR